MTLSGNFTHIAGTVDASSVTIEFKGYKTDIDASGITFGNVKLDVSGTTDFVSNLNVNGDLTVDNAATLNGGTINVSGNVTSNDTSISGSTNLTLNGTGNQSMAGSGDFNNLTINKPSGTVTFTENAVLTGDFTHTAGNVDAGSVTIEFEGYGTEIAAGSITFGDVVLDVSGTTDFANDLVIDGDVTVQNASTLNGSKIYASGSLTEVDSSYGGTTEFVIGSLPSSNDAPTANAGADQTVDEGSTVTLDASSSSDTDGDSLSYTWTQTAGPTVALSDTAAAQPNFTAPEGTSNTTLTFQVAVNDGTTTSYDTVTINVNADDDAPNASAGADQTVNEGTSVSLDASGSSDPEGQSMTYSWTQTGGPTVALSDASASQPSFTAPDVSTNTTLTFQVAVSDGTTTSYDTVNVDVTAGNTAPTANAGLDVTVNENELVTLGGGGTTPSGQIANWQFSENLDDSSASDLSATLQNGDGDEFTGSGTITFDGTDDMVRADAPELTGDYTTSIRIKPDATQNPWAGIYAATDETGATNHWNLQFDNKADRNIVIFHNGSNKWDTGIDLDDVAGDWHDVTIVRDGDTMSAYLDGALVKSGNWSVDPKGSADHLNIGGERTGSSDYLYTGEIDEIEIYNRALSDAERAAITTDAATGSDADGDSLTYTWTQTGGPTVSLSDSNASQPTFTAPEGISNSSLTFQVAVSDGTVTTYDTVTVTVNADDDAPTANAGMDQTVDEGASVSLDASASSDSEGQGLTYTWTQTSGTDVTLSDSGASQPTFTAPEGVANSTLTFQVAVSDGTTTSYDTVTITINADDDAPNASAGNDIIVNEGAAVALDAAGSTDPEGQGLTYTWTQTAGPTVALSDTADSQPTFTAPNVTSGTTLTFQVAVSDGTTTSYDTVDIVVNNTNTAADANAGIDQTVKEGSTVTLDGAGTSDADGDSLVLTWRQTDGPAVTLSDANAVQPTFTAPDVTEATTISFEVSVNDGSEITTDTVTITVEPQVEAEFVLTPIPDVTVDEGQSVTLRASASSANTIDFASGTITSYGGGQDVNATVSVEDTGSTLHLTGNGWKDLDFPYTVTENTILEFDFKVTETGEIHGIGFDTDDGISQNRTFQLHGTQDWGIGNYTADEVKEGEWIQVRIPVGEFYTGDFDKLFFVNDHDGGLRNAETFFSNVRVFESDALPDNLTYSWTQTGGPAVTLNNDTTSDLSFDTPDVDTQTTLTFQVEVSDGDVTKTDIVEVTVNPLPEPELLAFAGPNQSVQENSLVTLNGTANLGEAVAFQVDQLSSYGGSQDIDLDVSVEDSGTTLHLTGNGWKDMNFPYTVTENTVIEFDFKVTESGEIHGIGFDNDDALSENRTFQLHGTQDWGIGNYVAEDVEVGEWTRVRIPVGEFYTGDFDRLFFVSDHDGGGQNAESFFANLQVYEGDQTTENLTYTWTQTGGPTVALSDPNATQPTFTAPDGVTNSTLTFQLAVTDGKTTVFDTVEILVEATDAAPSASANGPANALVGEIVHLDATTSTDPEGQGLIFNWRQVSGPAVEMTGDDESIVNFAAPDVEDMTELVFEVAVSDGNSISYDTVTVSVTPTGLVVESSVVDAPGSTPTLPAAPSTPSEPNTEPDNNPSFEESVSTDNDILADDRQRSEAFDAINNGFVESPRDPIADVPGQTNQGSTPDSNPGSEPPVSVLRESDDELERNGTNGSTAPTDPREQHESRADSETTPRDGTGGLSDGRSPDIITNDHNDVRSGRNPSNGIESSAGPETATENLEESPWNGTEDLQLIDPMTGELDVMIDNELEENARASFLDSQAQLNEQKRTLQSQFDFEDEIVLPDSNVAFGVPGEEFTWDDQSSTLEQVFEQVVEGSTVPLVPLTDGSNPVSKDDEDEESTEENAMLRRRAVAESAKQASRPEIQSAGVSHEDNGTRDQENTKHSSGTNGFFANLWLAIRGVTFGPRNSQQERDSNSNR
ncbi:MAG: PKD domain-containing protein [Phycisphaerae bacterium]